MGGRRREEALAGNSGDGRCKIPLVGSNARNGKRSGGAGRSRARVAEMGVMNCEVSKGCCRNSVEGEGTTAAGGRGNAGRRDGKSWVEIWIEVSNQISGRDGMEQVERAVRGGVVRGKETEDGRR